MRTLDANTGLTWERLDHLFNIDVERGVIYWKNPEGNRVGWLRGRIAGCHKHKLGYVIIYLTADDGVKKAYKRHRLIWFYKHKRWPEHDLDHVDGRVSNDSLSNLREATKSQNMWNMKLRIDNKSGSKGVRWDAVRRKWKVGLVANYKEVFSGRFDSLEEAVAARMAAEREHHGQFARRAA